MGHSPSIDELRDQDRKFRQYLDELLDDINKKAADVRNQVNETISKHYSSGGWDDAKPFLDGENVDVQHVKDWSLDNVTKIIGAVKDAIFGTAPPPPGAKVADKKSEDIAPAFTAIAKLDEYIAAKAFDVISGILQSFMASTEVTAKREIKSEPLAPGLTLFVGILECGYQSQSFFQNEIITQDFYIYAVRYSAKEASTYSKFEDLEAYEDLKVAWRKKMDTLAQKIDDTEDLDQLKKLQNNFDYYTSQLDALQKKIESLQQAKITALTNRVESRLVNAGVLRQQIEALTRTTQTLEKRFVGVEIQLKAFMQSKVGATKQGNWLYLGHGTPKEFSSIDSPRGTILTFWAKQNTLLDVNTGITIATMIKRDCLNLESILKMLQEAGVQAISEQQCTIGKANPQDYYLQGDDQIPCLIMDLSTGKWTRLDSTFSITLSQLLQSISGNIHLVCCRGGNGDITAITDKALLVKDLNGLLS
ncbi:hypothetical protein [Calothrix sp. NIES-2098]|uniref:hypothetical protein n=1 Tax=Calothrix sp. NIES-2098 TaxID=1954171 RepID=UPI000B61EE71|nr:hypothetical protein NIES2098_51810 [Calothrix sp. NIES-2098]